MDPRVAHLAVTSLMIVTKRMLREQQSLTDTADTAAYIMRLCHFDKFEAPYSTDFDDGEEEASHHENL